MTKPASAVTNGAARPIEALRALRRLIADPERTHEVFVILRNLAGNALERGYARFSARPERLQWLRTPLLAALCDRDHLRSLPADSLGRAYLQFVESEGLSADGLVEASAGHANITDPAVRAYAERSRDMHDLWHVLTGYGRDTLGEVCLLAFTYAQVHNRGVGVIAWVGTIRESQRRGPRIVRAVWQGWRAGRRAAWLPGEHWETLLAAPLSELRERLSIGEPTAYRAMAAPRAASLAG